METPINRESTQRARNKGQYIRLILALGLIAMVVGVFILYLSWPLLTGRTIVLDTRPLDPFDPLRGQYIIINYEIGTVSAVGGLQEGDSVYITLKEDENKTARFEGAFAIKPSADLFIKGKMISNNGQNMRIEYGIEQYFFERHAQLPRANLQVKARVDANGNARIVELMQDGRPVVLQYETASN